jgi:uncharacterized membrane protein
MGANIKVIGAVVSTIITAAIAFWWLYIVYQRLGVKPEVDTTGKVVLDEFQRAKDILLVVLPLFTAALAYWTGSAGTTQAKQEAKETKKQLNAVLDSSPEGVLEKAKTAHPEAFADT